MTRDEAVALVQRVMDADYADDDEVGDLLEALDRALGCPSGYLSDLIFWPAGAVPTAPEIVDQALAYRPIAL
ncbi:hypothetical protein KGQ20_36145 [Catenulispora sp. NF23]|nr:hypothetical protein [Catenulispora pinistramenti]MBS2538197.1 hypothetical protein [Catenulispora pinistramenti]